MGRTTFTGAYIVNPDCTGSARFLFFNGAEANLDFVITNDGNDVFIIDTDQGTVEFGTAKKQFVRHRQGNDPQ
jgi:hypothetical protein